MEEAKLDPIYSQLQVIASNVLTMQPPEKNEKSVIVAARKYVAKELHGMGYSHRQIIKVLGLKSPQSITKYLS